MWHAVVLSHIHLLIIFENVDSTANSVIVPLLFQYLWRALCVCVCVCIYIYIYIYIYTHTYTYTYTNILINLNKTYN